ncbi:MAG: hypothetical protein ACSHYA_13035 [Opitutaceae bacterium]
MKLIRYLVFLIVPIGLINGFPRLPEPYDDVDWLDYGQWPERLEVNGNVLQIQVGSGGGCIVHSAPEGIKPSLESIQSWGNYSAYYTSVEPHKGDYTFELYGPYMSWDSNDEIITRGCADGKGAIFWYDKNGRVFYKEWSTIDGEVRSRSRGYYDRYGRLALEDRTTRSGKGGYSSQIYRYRKPCKPSEFEFTKEMLLENFDLYDHAYSKR